MNRLCEPPKHIDELPKFAQDELIETWKTYKSGQPCDQQLLITDDVLSAVDIFAQRHIIAAPYKSRQQAKTIINDLKEQRQRRFQKSTLISAEELDEGEEETITRTVEISNTENEHEADRSPYESTINKVITASRRPTKEDDSKRFIPIEVEPASERYSVDVSLPSSTPPDDNNDDYSDYLDERFSASGSTRPSPDLRYLTSSQQLLTSPSLPTKSPDLQTTDSFSTTDDDSTIDIYIKYEPLLEPLSMNDEGVDEFLRGTTAKVRRKFKKTITDPDIPSEGLRREKLHLLAVSLLNSTQLTAYNKYATRRRLLDRQHLTRLAKLSKMARTAYGVISRAEPEYQFEVRLFVAKSFPIEIRKELKRFATSNRSAATERLLKLIRLV
ncbi:unnamed protein product [Anisakis simplex]|uniref:Uncharacterized protein n=1 Tax=Anisakis simplex TaxID=6269 RepID=A0A0M3JVM8_ANISI|nr:unnamed protein product [Anisakis simplex]